MKKIVLRLYEFDELSKDSQEKIIERERWNVMDCCMEAYGDDYISTMKSFGDLTNTEAYDWEVGYTRYDFRRHKTRNMVMHTKIGTYGAIRYGKIFYKVIRI